MNEQRDTSAPCTVDPRPVILALSAACFALFVTFVVLYASFGGRFVAGMERSIGDVLLADAVRLENTGDYDNAVQTYRLALESRFRHQQTRTETLRRLGALVGWREGYREALPYLEEAFLNGDYSIWLYEPYGNALLAAARDDEAFALVEEWLARANKEDRIDQQALARSLEGRCYLKRGEKQRALDAFLAGDALQPGGINAYQAGVLSYELGDANRALQLLDLFLRDADGPQAEHARNLRDRICGRIRKERQ